MDTQLAGANCLVVGGADGIGAAIARLLLVEQARVLVAGQHATPLKVTADDATEARSHAFDVDATDPDAAEAIVSEFHRALGDIDVLVWAVGGLEPRELPELTGEDWNAEWRINVLAPVSMLRLVATEMADRGGGRILIVSSIAARRPSLRNAAYSATKVAQLSLVKLYSDHYGPSGVRVNAVAPGPTLTGAWGDGSMTASIAAERGIDAAAVLAERAQSLPTREFNSPEDVAAVAVSMLGSWTRNVTGSVWGVDSGGLPFI